MCDKIKSYLKSKLVWVFFLMFLSPFFGIWIWDLTNWHIFPLYTFGINNLKDFYTLWTAIFGAIAIGWNIMIAQRRADQNNEQIANQQTQLTNQQKQIDLQTAEQRENRFAKAV